MSPYGATKTAALRRRPRLSTRQIGLFAMLATALLVAAIDSGFIAGLFGPHGETVRARFADTAQLKNGDPVRVDGVTVGKVSRISLDDGGRSATVEMTVIDDAQPVYRDARAMLRWRTVLGGSFAVDLTRGDPSSGALGDRAIPPSRTESQVEVDDVLSFARRDARTGIRKTLRQVPTALAGADDVAVAARSLVHASPPLASALSAVRGQHEADLTPLIDATAKTTRALDAPTEPVRRLIAGAARTMSTTAVRAPDLQRALDLSGTIQPQVRQTLDAVQHTLDNADPLVEKLGPPAAEIAPTITHVQPLLAGTDRLLRQARPLLADLRPAVSSLARAARAGSPIVRDVAPSARRLAGRILPDLNTPDEVAGLRTYQLIGPVIASLNGAASTFDGDGHLFRFPALGGEHVLSDDLPCTTYFTDPESSALIKCQSLNDVLSTYLNYRPGAPPSGGRSK